MNCKLIKAIRHAARCTRPMLPLAALLACLLATGCTNELLSDGGDGDDKQGDVSVTLNLQTSASTVVNVRSVSENDIEHVYVLQYIGGNLVHYYRFSSTAAASPLTVTLKSMNSGTGNVLYVFANTDVMDANTRGSGTKLSNLITTGSLSTSSLYALNDLKALKLHTKLGTGGTGDSFENYLPMSGARTEAIGINSATRSITVSLKRRVAKINFTCSAAQLFSFAPTSVVLKNVPSHTVVAPNDKEPTGVGNIPSEFAAYPATFTPDNYSKTVTIPGSGGTREIPHTYTFYMPENVRGVYSAITDNKQKYPDGTIITEDPLRFTYIELKGISGKETATYRIYLGGNQHSDMNLLANYEYNITTTLRGINDADADTRIEVKNLYEDAGLAMESVVFDKDANCYMIYVSNKPTVYNIPISQAEKGVAKVNEISLAAGAGSIDFDPTSDWSAEVLWQTWEATTDNDIKTGNQLILNRHTDNRYLRVLVPTNVKNGNNAVIAIKNTAGKIVWSWHLWFTDYKPNAATDMNGETHVYAGISFTSPSGIFYNDGNPKRMMDRNLGTTWTEKAGLPIAKVMTTSGVSGETAYKAYGLMYQWGRKDPFMHYDGSSNPTIYNGIGTAVNATDGLIKSEVVTATYNLVNAIQEPTTFYMRGSIYDWYTASSIIANRNNYLWQPPGIEKTVFDPCPAGWRVPSFSSSNAVVSANALYSPWAGFSNGDPNSIKNSDSYADNPKFPWHKVGVSADTAGRLYIDNGGNNEAWYPASGWRSGYSGVFENIGSQGYCRSASMYLGDNSGYPDTTGYTYALRFQYNYILTESFLNKACAIPVRCIQD